jgi:hypothetical protein
MIVLGSINSGYPDSLLNFCMSLPESVVDNPPSS